MRFKYDKYNISIEIIPGYVSYGILLHDEILFKTINSYVVVKKGEFVNDKYLSKYIPIFYNAECFMIGA